MLIHLSAWPEIEARLASGTPLSRTVVVPIGSNEQHGPTGLLGTDWMCPEIIAHAAERTDEALTVACGTGAVRLSRVQRPGKAAQSAEEMLRGFPVPVGTVLG